MATDTLKIFLVDDDANNSMMVRSMLGNVKLPGYTFELDWVGTYDAALEVIQTHQHDVYLIDYHLDDEKDRDGLGLLREARHYGSTAPIIMLTGSGSVEIDLEAMKQGAVDYLEKTTLRPALLERSIRYAVERKRVETELQQLYAQVSALEQLKTDMIRIASHDLGGALWILLGYLDVLKTSEPLSDQQRMLIGGIGEAASSMQKITSDILSLERIEQLYKTAMESVDMVRLIRDVCAEYRMQIQQHKQVLDIQITSELVEIEGDSTQLRGAVANLLNNAIKYTPDGGRIEVQLIERGNSLIFEIEDNGYGIPEDQQARLFQPFFRAKSAETADIKGTGLGLHLVKNIIVRHKGEMRFRSSYGQGSMFGFRLPLLLSSNE